MITVSNLSKTYTSNNKNGNKVLDNVNIKFGNSGMVFILGKSGSGKTTLLNLLGGLDKPTGGEIIVNGVSTADFKRSDYDNYRNGYIGFVFQEFNLLKDFNVYENVSIALSISDEDSAEEKVSSALLKVGLNEKFLTRKTEELSGGEKQRVAIARAIVKESAVILADEPTGNLDAESGEGVWQVLKKLSEERLVIAVSHDRESAERYGDRIIEIKDGKIVSDSGETGNDKVGNLKKAKSKKLGVKFFLKMGTNNLLKSKIRSISVILFAVFGILAILITQMSMSYSSEKTFEKFIADNKIGYFSVARKNSEYGARKRFEKRTMDYVKEKCDYIRGGIVENKEEILNFGLSFKGEAEEIDENSFYITEVALGREYESPKSYVLIDGEEVKLVKELHPIDFLIGKKVKFALVNHFDFYVLAGVIDSGGIGDFSESALPVFFAKESFCGRLANGNAVYNIGYFDEDKEIRIEFGGKKYGGPISFGTDVNTAAGYFDGRILTEDGLKIPNEITLKDNEIILRFDLFDSIFSAYSEYYYVNPELTEIRNYPEELGGVFPLNVYEYSTGELIYGAGNYKIAGIGFVPEDYVSAGVPTPYFCGTQSALNKLILNFDNKTPILVKSDSVKNIGNFLSSLKKEYSVFVESVGYDVGADVDYRQFIYDFEFTVNDLKAIFGILSLILISILILFVMNLISFAINDRKKEIGVLSALGMKSRDITGIFITETLIVSLLAFVIDLIAVYLFGAFFNGEYGKGFSVVVPLLRVDYITVAVLFISSFALLLVAAYIPLIRLSKMKPIDAIKGL